MGAGIENDEATVERSQHVFDIRCSEKTNTLSLLFLQHMGNQHSVSLILNNLTLHY